MAKFSCDTARRGRTHHVRDLATCSASIPERNGGLDVLRGPRKHSSFFRGLTEFSRDTFRPQAAYLASVRSLRRSLDRVRDLATRLAFTPEFNSGLDALLSPDKTHCS